MPTMQTRGRFLTTLSLGGAAGFLRASPTFAAEGTLETTTLRIANRHSLCNAPQHVAEELLHAEGFTEIRYVDIAPPHITQSIVRGAVGFGLSFPVFFLPAIDAGVPITVLAGVHVGCFELFARKEIRSIAELRGGVSA